MSSQFIFAMLKQPIKNRFNCHLWTNAIAQLTMGLLPNLWIFALEHDAVARIIEIYTD